MQGSQDSPFLPLPLPHAEGAEDMLIALCVVCGGCGRRVGARVLRGGERAEACAEGARIEGDRGAARPGDGLRAVRISI